MAGLCQRYAAQQFHPVALTLVFTLLVSQCLASLQQLDSRETYSADDGTSQQQLGAPIPPSLRHILRRSAVAAETSSNTRDSTFEKQSYNFTDINFLQRNPPMLKIAEAETSSLLKENIHKNMAVKTASSTIETESSGRETETEEESDSPSSFQEVEYLKTKITDIAANEADDDQHHPVAGTERTKLAAESSVTTTPEDPIDNIACPECVKKQMRLQKLDPEAIRHLRLETIKMQILSKLRFEKPPNVTRGEVNIPAPLADGQFGRGEEAIVDYDGENEIGGKDYFAKTTQVIITAKDEHTYCATKSRNAGCFEFDLSQAAGMHIVSAEMWIYKIPSPTSASSSTNHTLVVSQLASRHSRMKKELARQSVSLQEAGWVTFEMKHKVQNMINHSQRQQRLEIFCEDCSEFGNDFPVSSKAGYRPFLAISTSEPKSRKQRSIDCTRGTSDCCRERFYVSFAEIGWDWIIQPKGYHANYCKGSCMGAVIPGYAHTSVLHGILASGGQIIDMIPCCAPRATKGISLIYYDNDQLIYRRELPDMVIESCACS